MQQTVPSPPRRLLHPHKPRLPPLSYLQQIRQHNQSTMTQLRVLRHLWAQRPAQARRMLEHNGGVAMILVAMMNKLHQFEVQLQLTWERFWHV